MQPLWRKITLICIFLLNYFLRSWRTDLGKGSCALVCVSVDHDDSPRMAAVRRVVLESQYLLEPCGAGRTRLTHISRVDLRCERTVFGVLRTSHSLYDLTFTFATAGEGLQNGTTKLSVTCVSMRSRWSAPPFTWWIRQAPKPRCEAQESGYVWSRVQNRMTQVEKQTHRFSLFHTGLKQSLFFRTNKQTFSLVSQIVCIGVIKTYLFSHQLWLYGPLYDLQRRHFNSLLHVHLINQKQFSMFRKVKEQ